jgi:hypothetical protein
MHQEKSGNPEPELHNKPWHLQAVKTEVNGFFNLSNYFRSGNSYAPGLPDGILS